MYLVDFENLSVSVGFESDISQLTVPFLTIRYTQNNCCLNCHSQLLCCIVWNSAASALQILGIIFHPNCIRSFFLSESMCMLGFQTPCRICQNQLRFIDNLFTHRIKHSSRKTHPYQSYVYDWVKLLWMLLTKCPSNRQNGKSQSFLLIILNKVPILGKRNIANRHIEDIKYERIDMLKSILCCYMSLWEECKTNSDYRLLTAQ